MALWQRGFRHGLVLVGVLLAACFEDDDKAYDKAIEAQHARAAAAAEAYRAQQDAYAQQAEAERVQREQAEFALESDPPAILNEEQLHQVIGYYCGDCHFIAPCAQCAQAGVQLNNLQTMISQWRVIPGDAEGSPLVQQMRQHTSPLPDGIPPVTDVALRLVVDFINQLPTPDAGTGY